MIRPGYYWLAYDWDNLLLSCFACNQRHKRNHFPLADPNLRADSHIADVPLEAPLFLHPVLQDPEEFIGFRKEIAFAINGNRSARVTIEALGLNREILNEVRRERLAALIAIRQLIELVEQDPRRSRSKEGKQTIADAKAFLARAVTDAGEFAAMAHAAARDDFRLALP